VKYDDAALTPEEVAHLTAISGRVVGATNSTWNRWTTRGEKRRRLICLRSLIDEKEVEVFYIWDRDLKHLDEDKLMQGITGNLGSTR
jgi:hypothetical protein